ncbi:hypothetical protein JIN85_09915 [Luteolibacter pohnpeiensis]|uniref:Uncharacterized protein n=1 Tax=Luteolibacter pohnpeiensis TaxID=454153 RepID=A0A934SAP7_9BACT|nr:hypothetical protein [Luteolibacter pohnpeiensis]MBK1882732.1 hypothetical protein [Luteolibacter pohnpeiensis]
MKTLPLISLTSLFLFTSCGKKPSVAVTHEPAISLDAYFTDSAPPDAQPIHLIRETAKPGDAVTISGRVMGRKFPFVDGRAAFVLGDPEVITACNDMPDDECETPWDACCETKEAISKATATIQILGEDGRVLKTSVKGNHGLKELSSVTLTGTLDQSSTPEALVINASSLHVAN